MVNPKEVCRVVLPLEFLKLRIRFTIYSLYLVHTLFSGKVEIVSFLGIATKRFPGVPYSVYVFCFFLFVHPVSVHVNKKSFVPVLKSAFLCSFALYRSF